MSMIFSSQTSITQNHTMHCPKCFSFADGEAQVDVDIEWYVTYQ
jgi:hypothetical protein